MNRDEQCGGKMKLKTPLRMQYFSCNLMMKWHQPCKDIQKGELQAEHNDPHWKINTECLQSQDHSLGSPQKQRLYHKHRCKQLLRGEDKEKGMHRGPGDRSGHRQRKRKSLHLCSGWQGLSSTWTSWELQKVSKKWEAIGRKEEALFHSIPTTIVWRLSH